MKKSILIMSLVFGLNAAHAQPNNVPTAGLVGYWPFDDNSANDLTANANHGTINGATPTTDRYNITNHAFDFNGTSDYIVVPNTLSNFSALSGFSDLSISVWIKTNGLTTVQAMVAKWFQTLNCGAGNNSDTYEVALSGSAVQFATNFNNTTGLSSPANLNSGDVQVWRHLVFVFDSGAGTMSVYIDGTLAHSSSTSGTSICSSLNDLYFGADWNGNTSSIWRYFDGALDDIGIWDAVLTPCEILGLYAPPTRESSDPPEDGKIAFLQDNTIKTSSKMEQNIPNPFINETVVKYNVAPQVQNAHLEIYDITGKQVTSIPLSQRGTSQITITSEKLSPGVYTYSIIEDGKKTGNSKKMIVAEK